MNFRTTRIKYIFYVCISLLLGLSATNYLAFFIVSRNEFKNEEYEKKNFQENKQEEITQFLKLYKNFFSRTKKEHLKHKIFKTYTDFILKFHFEPSDLYISSESEVNIINKLGATEEKKPYSLDTQTFSEEISNDSKINLCIENNDLMKTFNGAISNRPNDKYIYICLNLFVGLILVSLFIIMNRRYISYTKRIILELRNENEKKQKQLNHLSTSFEKEKFFSDLSKQIILCREEKNKKIRKGTEFVMEYLQLFPESQEISNVSLSLLDELDLPLGSEFSKDDKKHSLKEILSDIFPLIMNEVDDKKIDYSFHSEEMKLKIPKNVIMLAFFNILKSTVLRVDTGGFINIKAFQEEELVSITIKSSSFYISNRANLSSIHLAPKSLRKMTNETIEEMFSFYGYQIKIQEEKDGNVVILINASKSAPEKQKNILEFKRV